MAFVRYNTIVAKNEALDEPLKKVPLGRRLLGEAVGTFVLTTTAAGADILDHIYPGGIGHVARYTAPALAVMAMIWSLSGLCGAHINPAISVGFALRRSFPWRDVTPYVVAQLTGAIVAALMLRALFGNAIGFGITRNLPPFSAMQAFGLEVVLTFFLAFTILGTADQKAVVGKNAALAVGGVVALCGLAFSPVSGSSMNPARSLGPMIAAIDFRGAFTYIVAPLVGAAIAAAMAELVYGHASQPDKEAAQGKGA